MPQDTIFEDEEQMEEINEKLEKLESGSCSMSIRDDLIEDNMIFSEESSRVIYEMGNMELFELRQTTDTIQCHSCLRHIPRELKFCEGLSPSRRRYNKQNQRQIPSFDGSLYIAIVNRSREQNAQKKQQWQEDLRKAMDVKRSKSSTILERGQDVKKYRTSQWTEVYCRYLIISVAVGYNLQSAVVNPLWCPQIQVADHNGRPYAGTCLPAHARSCALEWEPPSPKDPCHCASCAVVAKAVERTATPAVANGQEEGKVDPSEHLHAERLGVKLRHLGGWERHERRRRERARLGPQQSSLLRWQGGHQHVLSEVQLEALCCEHLPTETRLGPVLLFDGTSPWSQTFSQLFPRGRWKPVRLRAASLIVTPSRW